MLVLSRKCGESVVVGSGPNAVTVTIVQAANGRVRIGFEASKDVTIMRSELLTPSVAREVRERVAGLMQ